MKRKKEHFYFAYEVAKTITSKFNQHETLMIVGPKGSGKSWVGLSIAYDVSIEVAKIKGGKHEDYFTIEKVAIITKEEVIRVLKIEMGRFCIVIFDDIGVGWSARDFATKFNKLMNNIYQTFRTKNVFLIMTLPDPQLIDNVPRFMLHYFMEIVESHHELGYVECKLKESVRIPLMKKNIYPFVSKNGISYPRHIVFTAPSHLTDEYEPRRIKIEKDNSDKSIAELESMELENNVEKMSKRSILTPAVISLKEKNPFMSNEKIGHMVGCGKDLVRSILDENNMGPDSLKFGGGV